MQTARAYHLDPILVCAVCEQESGWEPFAIRWEPAFYTRYVAPQNLLNETEATMRAVSFGLMQVMGQVAREHGFKGKFLSMLCDPMAGLDIGCKVLQSKMAARPSSSESGLLAYNGGGNPNYGKEVLARCVNYAARQNTTDAV